VVLAVQGPQMQVMDATLGAARWSTLSPGSLADAPSLAPDGAMTAHAARDGRRAGLDAVPADGRVRPPPVLAAGDVLQPARAPCRPHR